MRRLLVFLVLVAGCDSLGDGRRLRDARAAVARNLRDPASAQFRDVKPGTPGYVCGEANGKNAYGAYSGFARFIVDSLGRAEMEADSTRFSDAEWTAACDGERLPTAEERKAFRDSVRGADSVAFAARADSINAHTILKLGNQSWATILKLHALNRAGTQSAERASLLAVILEEGVNENHPAVIGVKATRVVYDKFCREMVRELAEIEWFPSVKAAVAGGFRTPQRADCNDQP